MVHLRAPVRWGGMGRGCWMLREEPSRCVSLLSCNRSTPFQRRGLTCRSFRPRPALLRLRVVWQFEMIHCCIAGRILCIYVKLARISPQRSSFYYKVWGEGYGGYALGIMPKVLALILSQAPCGRPQPHSTVYVMREDRPQIFLIQSTPPTSAARKKVSLIKEQICCAGGWTSCPGACGRWRGAWAFDFDAPFDG